MASNPLVSICIPTYNRCESLIRTVESVLLQTWGNIEIIISDNGSTDQTEVFCRELARVNSNIRYFRHPVNRGPIFNFNFVRAMARGEYFMWLGDDDRMDQDLISRCLEIFRSDPGFVLVSPLGAYHKAGEEQVHHYGNLIRLDYDLAEARLLNYLVRVADNSVFCGIYRTDVTADLLLPPDLGGDWVWLARVLCRGKAHVDPDLTIHRRFGDTTSSSYERIVQTLCSPAWQAKYPWAAILYNGVKFFPFSQPRRPLPGLATQAAKGSLQEARLFLVMFLALLLKILRNKLPF